VKSFLTNGGLFFAFCFLTPLALFFRFSLLVALVEWLCNRREGLDGLLQLFRKNGHGREGIHDFGGEIDAINIPNEDHESDRFPLTRLFRAGNSIEVVFNGQGLVLKQALPDLQELGAQISCRDRPQILRNFESGSDYEKQRKAKSTTKFTFILLCFLLGR